MFSTTSLPLHGNETLQHVRVTLSLWTTESPHSTVWWLYLSSCWIRCLLKWTYWPLKASEISQIASSCRHFQACLHTLLFKRGPEEGCYISLWSMGELSATLDLEYEQPHAQPCETLDCFRNPQDRETIDYHFTSFFSTFRHVISEHTNWKKNTVHNLLSLHPLHWDSTELP